VEDGAFGARCERHYLDYIDTAHRLREAVGDREGREVKRDREGGERQEDERTAHERYEEDKTPRGCGLPRTQTVHLSVLSLLFPPQSIAGSAPRGNIAGLLSARTLRRRRTGDSKHRNNGLELSEVTRGAKVRLSEEGRLGGLAVGD
jgi:hypothetical protein